MSTRLRSLSTFSRDVGVLEKSDSVKRKRLDSLEEKRDRELVESTGKADDSRQEQRGVDREATLQKSSVLVTPKFEGTLLQDPRDVVGASNILRNVTLFDGGSTGKVVRASISDILLPPIVTPVYPSDRDDPFTNPIQPKTTDEDIGVFRIDVVFYRKVDIAWVLIRDTVNVPLTLERSDDVSLVRNKRLRLGSTTPLGFATQVNGILSEFSKLQGPVKDSPNGNYPIIGNPGIFFLNYIGELQRFVFVRPLQRSAVFAAPGELGQVITDVVESRKFFVQAVTFMWYDERMSVLTGFGDSRVDPLFMAPPYRQMTNAATSPVNPLHPGVGETIFASFPTQNWTDPSIYLRSTLPFHINVVGASADLTVLAAVRIVFGDVAPVFTSESLVTDFSDTSTFPNAEIWTRSHDFWWTFLDGTLVSFLGNSQWSFKLTIEYIPR